MAEKGLFPAFSFGGGPKKGPWLFPPFGDVSGDGVGVSMGDEAADEAEAAEEALDESGDEPSDRDVVNHDPPPTPLAPLAAACGSFGGAGLGAGLGVALQGDVCICPNWGDTV